MAKAKFNSPLASRSKHDLGYQFIGSSDFGRITPFFCKELIPTDHFSIRTSAFVRMLPLVVPTFGQADLQIHFAFVPSRMICDGFNDILSNKGKYASSKLPSMSPAQFKGLAAGFSTETDPLTGHSKNHDFYCQLTGFGLPDPKFFSSPMPNISMLPFRAYQRFWWDFFRDAELIPDSDIDQYLLTTTGIDSIGATKQKYYETRYRTFRSTWLSSLYKQAGADDTNVEIQELQQKLRQNITELSSLQQVTLDDTQSGNVWDTPTFNSLTSLVLSPNGYFQGQDGSNSYYGAFLSSTARGQRVAEACTRLRERANAAQKRVIDQIEAIYGKISQWLILNRVQYLGGSSSPIQISDVTSTADTYGTDTGASLGAQAGKGIAASRGDRIDYTAEEHGYIIGVYSIMPRQNFCQGIPKEFTRNVASDIFTKDYEHIGFMPVQNCEVYVPETKSPSQTYSVNGVFGYTEPYYEYKRSLDVLQGDMRKYTMEDINHNGIYSSYNLYRLINPALDNPSSIDFNQAFFSVGNYQFNRIFEFGGSQSYNQDHFFVNLDIQCQADRPMDGFAVPSLDTQEQPHSGTKSVSTRE